MKFSPCYEHLKLVNFFSSFILSYFILSFIYLDEFWTFNWNLDDILIFELKFWSKFSSFNWDLDKCNQSINRSIWLWMNWFINDLNTVKQCLGSNSYSNECKWTIAIQSSSEPHFIRDKIPLYCQPVLSVIA